MLRTHKWTHKAHVASRTKIKQSILRHAEGIDSSNASITKIYIVANQQCHLKLTLTLLRQTKLRIKERGMKRTHVHHMKGQSSEQQVSWFQYNV
jgi:hypothetical protein